MIHMKNRLVGLLVFALVAFNLYAQSDQSKKGLLTFTGTRIISFDPMREMPKMAWYSENQDIRVDEEVLFNNQSSLLIPSVRGITAILQVRRLCLKANTNISRQIMPK